MPASAHPAGFLSKLLQARGKAIGKSEKPLILAGASGLKESPGIFMRGGIIAYPTETFYGLGVDPFNKEAVERLFELKGRSEKSPVSLIIKDTDMLKRVAQEVPERAEVLMKKFWPGPLTIVFKARSTVPERLVAHTGKIGVRVSSSPEAMKLVEALDSPITATSANPSGRTPPASPAEVIEYFNGSIDLLIDGGRLPGRAGSTVVDITGDKTVILREGEIPGELVFKAIES